jgi:hypothetical protein
VPDLRFVSAWFARYGLPLWFAGIFAFRLSALIGGPPGFDATLYLTASKAWLAGDDPWLHIGAIQYAAPPPSLLALAPLAVLPIELGVGIMLGLSVAGVILTVRMLHLPWWWVLFPPFLDGAWNGNPQTLLVPLILAGAGPIAIFLKIYAAVPVALTLRWKALLVTGAALLVTAPFLPWIPYLERFGDLSRALVDQSDGGLSATAFPILIPVALVVLVLCGREKAAWLAVPVAWPATQWYYATLAVPALTTSTLAAAPMALPVAGAPLAAAVVVAWGARLIDWPRLRDAWVPVGILGRP